ncbi:MAG: hypothetical protein ACKO2K_00055, partial [Alphaproteobacteria bacterium]
MKRRRGGIARDDSPAALMAATVGPRPRRRGAKAKTAGGSVAGDARAEVATRARKRVAAETGAARAKAPRAKATARKRAPRPATTAAADTTFPTLPPPPRPRLDTRRARTYPLERLASKFAAAAVGRALEPGLSFSEWLARLPDILAAADLRLAADTIARTRLAGRG